MINVNIKQREVYPMICKNLLCIYYLDGNCMLEKVTVDVAGLCEQCDDPTITESELGRAVKAQLHTPTQTHAPRSGNSGKTPRRG